MHASTRSTSLLLLVVLALLLAAGCGGGSDDDAAAPEAEAVSLTHVDGAIELIDSTLTVTPANGGEEITLAVGPAIEPGAVQALAAAGTKARVYYRDEASPTAAKVEEAPTRAIGATVHEGQVVKVSKTRIVIDGDDGEHSFTIRDEDRAAFDVGHLTEHRAEGEPVRVYVQSDADGEYAVSYEDA
ncbi:MAG: hypothetical protein JWM25_1426 [Thermoleophilia bacterium]|nr:hypothetical protein [Thermoleophilia bacterium]MCZ4496843.1 hypothetical protein [Thermoleophilia bacterium]